MELSTASFIRNNGTPMSFDTIKNYDYVVLGKEIDQTKYGKSFIQKPYYSIYKR